MANSTNTSSSLSPILKESYSDTKQKDSKADRFKKLRKKLLKNWKPKKTN